MDKLEQISFLEPYEIYFNQVYKEAIENGTDKEFIELGLFMSSDLDEVKSDSYERLKFNPSQSIYTFDINDNIKNIYAIGIFVDYDLIGYVKLNEVTISDHTANFIINLYGGTRH